MKTLLPRPFERERKRDRQLARGDCPRLSSRHDAVRMIACPPGRCTCVTTEDEDQPSVGVVATERAPQRQSAARELSPYLATEVDLRPQQAPALAPEVGGVV